MKDVAQMFEYVNAKVPGWLWPETDTFAGKDRDMSRVMNTQEWSAFESAVRHFCELRAEYRRRREAGTLGSALDHRMVQSLNALELDIDRMKSGNELARIRARHKEGPLRGPAFLRKAQ